MLNYNTGCGGGGNQIPSRQQLMDTINQSSFAVDDILLYLDTHPHDMEALTYFQKQSAIRKDAMKHYAMHYGPLTIDTVDDSNSDAWEWMMQPWPWEIPQKGRC